MPRQSAAKVREPWYPIGFGELEDSDYGCARTEIYTSAPRQAWKGHRDNEYADVKEVRVPFSLPRNQSEPWPLSYFSLVSLGASELAISDHRDCAFIFTFPELRKHDRQAAWKRPAAGNRVCAACSAICPTGGLTFHAILNG